MSLVDPGLEARAARRAGYCAELGDWGERAAYQAAFQAGGSDAQTRPPGSSETRWLD